MSTNELMKQVMEILNTGQGTCPHCRQPVDGVEQVGRCVYGSCGCRICQGEAGKDTKRISG